MKAYLVGGAVRDDLLGRKPNDIDYVLVGATKKDIQIMLDKGYVQVGKDFPIFIHQPSGYSYSLARRERAPGIGKEIDSLIGDVTLEEDLSRRDLTINAMAKHGDEEIVDPFGGQNDLKNKILRHVSDSFAEDPIRILRVAKFAARHPDFTVAPETMEFMRKMVVQGTLNHFEPARAWQEISQGLMECKPSRMLDVLKETGALDKVMPELSVLWGIPQPEKWHPEIDTGVHIQQVVDYAAEQDYELPVRFAAMLHDVGKGVTPKETWPAHHGHEELGIPLVEAICARMKVPSDCASMARVTAKNHGKVCAAFVLTPQKILEIFKEVDAFRRPERLTQLLRAAKCDAKGRNSETVQNRFCEFHQKPFLRAIFDRVIKLDNKSIVSTLQQANQMHLVSEKIHAARINAIKSALRDFDVMQYPHMLPTVSALPDDLSPLDIALIKTFFDGGTETATVDFYASMDEDHDAIMEQISNLDMENATGLSGKPISYLDVEKYFGFDVARNLAVGDIVRGTFKSLPKEQGLPMEMTSTPIVPGKPIRRIQF